MAANPYATRSDSFYFVLSDGTWVRCSAPLPSACLTLARPRQKLIMHNKAAYRYYTDGTRACTRPRGLLTLPRPETTVTGTDREQDDERKM